MTYRSRVLLLCPAAVADLTALIYAANRHRKATALLSDFRNDLKELLNIGSTSGAGLRELG